MVGARFRTLAAAVSALNAIRSAVTIAPGDAAVRPLGSTRYEEPCEDYLLAGRFDDGDVETVAAIVAARGGQVIERRREPAGRSTAATRPRGPQAIASNPPWAATWVPAGSGKSPATGKGSAVAAKGVAVSTKGGAGSGKPSAIGRAVASRHAPRSPRTRPRARLRRPAAPLRIRAARSHRSGSSKAQ